MACSSLRESSRRVYEVKSVLIFQRITHAPLKSPLRKMRRRKLQPVGNSGFLSSILVVKSSASTECSSLARCWVVTSESRLQAMNELGLDACKQRELSPQSCVLVYARSLFCGLGSLDILGIA